MAHCTDCGTKLSDGCCPNCSEELFIYETQGDYLPNVSDDFMAKVVSQEIDRANKTKE